MSIICHTLSEKPSFISNSDFVFVKSVSTDRTLFLCV